MNTSKYTGDLLVALRLRDVPSERIGQIIAEVESHVADTGEDPQTAFGKAREYAKAVAPSRGDWTSPGMLVRIVWGAATGWALADGTISLILGEEAVFGIRAWIMLALGVLLAGVMIAVLSRDKDVVVDPRSGKPMTLATAPAIGVVLASLAGIAVIVALVLRFVE